MQILPDIVTGREPVERPDEDARADWEDARGDEDPEYFGAPFVWDADAERDDYRRGIGGGI